MTSATRAALDDIAVALGRHPRRLSSEWFDPAQVTP